MAVDNHDEDDGKVYNAKGSEILPRNEMENVAMPPKQVIDGA